MDNFVLFLYVIKHFKDSYHIINIECPLVDFKTNRFEIQRKQIPGWVFIHSKIPFKEQQRQLNLIQ